MSVSLPSSSKGFGAVSPFAGKTMSRALGTMLHIKQIQPLIKKAGGRWVEPEQAAQVMVISGLAGDAKGEYEVRVPHSPAPGTPHRWDTLCYWHAHRRRADGGVDGPRDPSREVTTIRLLERVAGWQICCHESRVSLLLQIVGIEADGRYNQSVSIAYEGARILPAALPPFPPSRAAPKSTKIDAPRATSSTLTAIKNVNAQPIKTASTITIDTSSSSTPTVKLSSSYQPRQRSTIPLGPATTSLGTTSDRDREDVPNLEQVELDNRRAALAKALRQGLLAEMAAAVHGPSTRAYVDRSKADLLEAHKEGIQMAAAVSAAAEEGSNVIGNKRHAPTSEAIDGSPYRPPRKVRRTAPRTGVVFRQRLEEVRYFCDEANADASDVGPSTASGSTLTPDVSLPPADIDVVGASPTPGSHHSLPPVASPPADAHLAESVAQPDASRFASSGPARALAVEGSTTDLPPYTARSTPALPVVSAPRTPADMPISYRVNRLWEHQMNWREREPLRERSPDRIWHLLGMLVKMHLGEGVSVETKRVLRADGVRPVMKVKEAAIVVLPLASADETLLESHVECLRIVRDDINIVAVREAWVSECERKKTFVTLDGFILHP